MNRMHERRRFPTRFRPALLALAALALSIPEVASARDWLDGVYVKGFGGASFLPDLDASQRGLGAPGSSGDLELDPGGLGGVALGYDVTERFALEVAWEYRSNGLDQLELSDGTLFRDGDLASNVFWANGNYRFGAIGKTRFRPYLGAGVGWVEEIDLDLEGPTGTTSYSQTNRFAYQFMGGVAYAIDDHWDLSTELRYTRIESINLEQEGTGNGRVQQLDTDPVSLELGVTYRF